MDVATTVKKKDHPRRLLSYFAKTCTADINPKRPEVRKLSAS